jgi:hypothetical protein
MKKNKVEIIRHKLFKSQKIFTEILELLGKLERSYGNILNEDNDKYLRLREELTGHETDLDQAIDLWNEIQIQLIKDE